MKFRDWERSGRERNSGEGEIRVNDRRRRYLNDDEANTPAVEASEPSLKPSYVEELEKRTQAAEQLALDVQSRR